VAEATIGGIYEVMYRRIVTEGPRSLGSLHPELVYLALTPFLGPKAALRASGLEVTVASIASRGQSQPTKSGKKRPGREIASGQPVAAHPPREISGREVALEGDST
jgi:hypothetical protein